MFQFTVCTSWFARPYDQKLRFRFRIFFGNLVQQKGDANCPVWISQTSLSGTFLRRASLSIPHRTSFAATLSVGTRIANVSLSHESQREIALVTVQALSKLIPDYQQGEVGEKTGLCFARFVFLMFCGPFVSHDSNPYLDRN